MSTVLYTAVASIEIIKGKDRGYNIIQDYKGPKRDQSNAIELLGS